MNPFDLVVVGGGAAGFMTAVTAAENGVKRIIILEGSSKLMEKVRISGGGRCNVTNASWIPSELAENYPRGGIKLLESFNRFAAGDVFDWFEKRIIHCLKSILPITSSVLSSSSYHWPVSRVRRCIVWAFFPATGLGSKDVIGT